VALVHRPAYDDWTLPKGKLEPGESRLDGAVREVREETGLHARLGPQLGTTSYVDSHDRDKTVWYWAAAGDGELGPTKEIDEARWVPVEQAPEVLSYERDLEVLERALALIDSGAWTP